MTFVPVFTPPPAPSARSVELGNRLTQAVREFRASQPELSGAEVSQAFQIAGSQLRSELGGSGAPVAILAVSLGLLVAGLFALFLFQGGGLPQIGPIAYIAVAVGGLAALALVIKAVGRGA